MPKVLVITAAYNCGAPGRIVEQIGIMAQDYGWDVYTVHGVRHSNPSQLKTLCKVTTLQEYLHAIVSYCFDGQGLGGYFYTNRIANKIKELNPDIIHIHNIHGYYINYPVLMKCLKELHKPVIWTFHDLWPITGHCAHFDYNGCIKWKTECHKCKFYKDYPRSLVDRSRRNYNLKQLSFTGFEKMTLVPVSDWVGSLLAESYLKDYPIYRIYNGVDTEIFYPRKSDIKSRLGLEDKIVLLGVASPWSNMKGFNDYLELRKKLSDKYAIVMIGLTRQQIMSMPNGIIGIERTQNINILAEYYSIADITLNLSYQETFGMTTIEGMACGTPGIVYNKTASPELVTSETGTVVEAGNIQQLVHAVATISSNGKSTYSAACRNRVIMNFDIKSQYNKYISLYAKLLNSSVK